MNVDPEVEKRNVDVPIAGVPPIFKVLDARHPLGKEFPAKLRLRRLTQNINAHTGEVFGLTVGAHLTLLVDHEGDPIDLLDGCQITITTYADGRVYIKGGNDGYAF